MAIVTHKPHHAAMKLILIKFFISALIGKTFRGIVLITCYIMHQLDAVYIFTLEDIVIVKYIKVKIDVDIENEKQNKSLY